MIRGFNLRGVELSHCSRGAEVLAVEEPTTPSKKKLNYLWISLQSRRALLFLSRLQRWGDTDWTTIYGGQRLGGSLQAAMKLLGLGSLRTVKLTVLILGLFNLAILVVGALVAVGASHFECSSSVTVSAAIMCLGSGLRLVWMLAMGFTQIGCASIMIAEEEDAPEDPISTGGFIMNTVRSQRRIWYGRWLWCSRIGTGLAVLQIIGLAYFAWSLTRNVRIDSLHVKFCSRGEGHVKEMWLVALMVTLPVVGGVVVLAQCCVGSDVLAWRLLYGAHYDAWRAHYRQMFDHSIREAMFCLGRRRYMSVKTGRDEVDSIASLLGDLVAYRAAGASHLEVIAGVALLREKNEAVSDSQDLGPVPDALLTEGTILHPYAEAAYTGPLLDVGRNPLTFPCAWLYRQGILTAAWTRNRRPALEGDNWWRGHAAAFLKHAQVPAAALRQGRVLQANREAAYFVVVLEKHRTVLVTIRGTETPEDLLTDGLGTECAFTRADLQGFQESKSISESVKKELLDTMPHFGHVGVIEAARELALQLDNLGEDDEGHDLSTSANETTTPSEATDWPSSTSENRTGLLTSLLGPGGECESFSLRLIGHSLGGAIAAVTALRLAGRFPNLHVYGYGTLPCMDHLIAEACSPFTTSIIYNDEFSSRLSIAAILRLRAAALHALAADSNTDTALVTKLTRRLLRTSSQENGKGGRTGRRNPSQICRRYLGALKGGGFICSHACRCLIQMPKHRSASHPTTLQLSTFKQEYNSGGESLHHTTPISGQEASRLKLDATDNSEVSKQFSGEQVRNGFGQSDGEEVGVVAGTDINEEAAVVLMGSSDDNEIAARSDEISEEGNGSLPFELLENGMPKGMSDIGGGADVQDLWPAEMFVPGLVIHLVRRTESIGSKWFTMPLTLSFTRDVDADDGPRHQAVLRDRKFFKDVLVTPTMFLDHMPWKCQYALNDLLTQMKSAEANSAESTDNSV